MKPRWRIIDTGADDAFTNMALDEALFRGYKSGFSPPTLRIYSWRNPSLTLGYSQDTRSELDTDLCRERSVPFVRRLTGGGVILHDKEITYSLVCSKEDLDIPPQVDNSYKAICSFLISFYKKLGLEAQFACDRFPAERLGVPSALCFASKEKYDIVIRDKKIGGNAQKRSKDFIFQHGSIPLSVDMQSSTFFLRDKKYEAGDSGVASLEGLLGCKVRAFDISKMLTASFAESFGITPFSARLSDAEEAVAMDLKKMKYESPEWNFERIDKTALESEEEIKIT